MISRQRTSSIACIGGLLTFFILRPAFFLRVSLPIRLVMTLSAFGAIAFLLFAGPETAYNILPQKFRAAAERRQTINARELIWSSALFKYSTWSNTDKVLGLPAGQPYELIVKDRDWTSSVHNTYIGILMLYGGAGLLTFLALVVGGLISALAATFDRRTINGFGITPAVAVGWLAIMIIYGYSYEWRNAVTLFALAPLAGWSALRTEMIGRRAAATRPAAPRYRLATRPPQDQSPNTA